MMADKQRLQKMARALLAQQRKDGGWGQLPTLESDAYATGQALVALHQAGGLPITHRAYQRLSYSPSSRCDEMFRPKSAHIF